MQPEIQHTPFGHQTAQVRVSTPVYEGPLDLLLELIEHAELDITALSLAMVTDQYLERIRQMHVTADEISAFLVVAARLLQIKSESLLPRPPVREPGEEDPGEELARQLRIYRRFKEISQWLEDRLDKNLRTHLRVAAPLPFQKKLDISTLNLDELVSLALEVFAGEEQKQALGTVIAPPAITIREKLALITKCLGRQQFIKFNNLLGTKPSRLEVVVTFLAILELIKRYRVSASQDKLFSEIHIEKLEEWGAEEEIELEFE